MLVRPLFYIYWYARVVCGVDSSLEVVVLGARASNQPTVTARAVTGVAGSVQPGVVRILSTAHPDAPPPPFLSLTLPLSLSNIHIHAQYRCKKGRIRNTWNSGYGGITQPGPDVAHP